AAVAHGAGSGPNRSASQHNVLDDGDDAVFVACTDFAGAAPIASNPGGLAKSPDDVDEFILDSAATRHLVCDRQLLHGVRELAQPISLRIADGNTLELRQIGSCQIRTSVQVAGTSPPQLGQSVTLQDVACDERLWCNLISLTRIVRAGYDVTCGATEAVVRRRDTGRVVMTVPKRGQLYVLSVPKSQRISGSSLGAGQLRRHGDVGFAATSVTPPTPAIVLANDQASSAAAAIPAMIGTVNASANEELTKSQQKRRARRAKAAAASAESARVADVGHTDGSAAGAAQSA
ncbi:MAG: hypothetical protein P4L99_09335, partial [Chthoniobacter sp.]|nr:hypothetical protein [Chthoniobacter sp.]